MFQSSKPKSATKIALPRSEAVSLKALNTLKKTADIVGSTLGPFGQQVLIERPESGLKPFTTKDGVTVHKHIGYEDSIEQVVLEASRDAAVRTAQEAGDGTTTCSILSHSIAEKTYNYTKNNRKCPPQKIVREINGLVKTIEEKISQLSTKVDTENYKSVLHKVATLSANGDSEMADVIMEAYDLIGDQGNIIVSEEYGNPGYAVSKFEGYTVEKGFEDSCGNFYPAFINDHSSFRIFLKNPMYVLYDGKLTDKSTLLAVATELDAAMNANPEKYDIKNIVFFAHEFSRDVLSLMAMNFESESTFKFVPVLTSQSFVMNSQTQFLHDIAAFTGAKVYNPISSPLNVANADDLVKGRSEAFESGRYRSTIIGTPDLSSVQLRVDELNSLKGNAESVYDSREIETRIAKLTCGIAKVKVIGPSQSEIREKKDRADDAWCAVRSATKHGTLPGGGWTLVRLSVYLSSLGTQLRLQNNTTRALACDILASAFLRPVEVLYKNAGYNDDEIHEIVHDMMEDETVTFDLQEGSWVNTTEILDSTSAVVEAIRNSISIASLLGTLGGVVVFKRDSQADADDRKSASNFAKAVEDGQSSATSMNTEDLNSY